MVFEIRKGPREIRIWMMMNNNSQFLKWNFRRCVGGIIQSVQQQVRIRLLKKQRRSICHVTSGIKQSITHNRLVLHYSRSVKRCYGFQPIGATRCYALLYNNWGVFCKVLRIPKRYKIINSNSPIRSGLVESHFLLANSNRQFYIFLERVRHYIHWLSVSRWGPWDGNRYYPKPFTTEQSIYWVPVRPRTVLTGHQSSGRDNWSRPHEYYCGYL